MATFTLYFTICLLALIVRGYYRVPPNCIIHEIIDKEEDTKKSIIADRPECKCHYTNFLRHINLFNYDNQTMMNTSMLNITDKRQFEPAALVRSKNKTKHISVFSFIRLLMFLMD
jgi:hypothetical protein